MCTECKEDVKRVPVEVVRVPITVISDNGYNSGGWGALPPDRHPPQGIRVPKNCKLYWCPWCGSWNVYTPKNDGQLYCSGWCGWGNTAEFYTRSYNDLWGV